MSDLLAAWFIAGVLIQQTLSLAVVRQKVRQVACKAARRLPSSHRSGKSLCGRLVRWIDGNFFEVLMSFLLSVIMLTGVLYLIFQQDDRAFTEAKAVSAVVILVASFRAGIRIVVERFNTDLECV